MLITILCYILLTAGSSSSLPHFHSSSTDDDSCHDFARNKDSGNKVSDISQHRNIGLLTSRNCGIIEDDRLVGGNMTSLYDMPWMVLLAYDSDRGTKLSCVGTLIHERYVLTAAHCVEFLGSKLRLTGVVLGEYDTRQNPDCERIEGQLSCAPNSRNASIETVISHPNYSRNTLVDDIALIRLAEPADFTLPTMKPLCLPITKSLMEENLEGKFGTVAGWGTTEDGTPSPVLLKINLPIVSNQQCHDAYNGSPQIHPSQICAGGQVDKDSCGGDSGGPLMYESSLRNIGVRLVQRGIVSYGPKRCGIGGYPAVFTRVSSYMNWILDNIHD